MGNISQYFGALAGAVLALTLTGPRVMAQQASAPAAERSAELNNLLNTWARNSSQIHTLSCKFMRRDFRPGFGRREFLYTVRWKDSGKADVNIEAILSPNKTQQVQRLVWTGREVWDFMPYKKEIQVWPMDKIGEYEEFREMVQDYWAGRLTGNQFDLIFASLSSPKEVDPLPFLIGMKDVVAKKQFTYERLTSADPTQLVVCATPVKTNPKPLFNDVMITLDKDRCLPVALEYRRGIWGKDTRRYTILEVRLDQPIDDASFEPHIPEGWHIKKERD